MESKNVLIKGIDFTVTEVAVKQIRDLKLFNVHVEIDPRHITDEILEVFATHALTLVTRIDCSEQGINSIAAIRTTVPDIVEKLNGIPKHQVIIFSRYEGTDDAPRANSLLSAASNFEGCQFFVFDSLAGPSGFYPDSSTVETYNEQYPNETKLVFMRSSEYYFDTVDIRTLRKLQLI